jgi:hypothetical protein
VWGCRGLRCTCGADLENASSKVVKVLHEALVFEHGN